jgi:hypothetical protein
VREGASCDESLYFVKPPAPPAGRAAGGAGAPSSRVTTQAWTNADDPIASIRSPVVSVKGAMRRCAMARGHP